MSEDILVIDDDPVITRMLSRVLTGHKVVVSNNGHDALERLKAQSFRLILCDLAMPGMSGIDFFESVRAISPDLARRVVFMSGGAFTAESHEFLNEHQDCFLEKPFDINTLRELIRARAEV